MKFILFFCYCCLVYIFIVLTPPSSLSEFYQYINKDGVKCYTDDPSLISELEEEKIIVHKDKYDGLDEEEKKQLKAREEQKAFEAKQRTIRSLDSYQKKERIKDAKKAMEEAFKKSTTPVRISRNRILAPVTIGYAGKSVATWLLLDTGASITAVDNSISEQLNISSGQTSAVRVAGGGVLKTRIVNIEFIKVGPKTYKSPRIMVLNQKGPAEDFHGLLGQDFLSHFSYTIDYSKSVIVWR